MYLATGHFKGLGQCSGLLSQQLMAFNICHPERVEGEEAKL
jgi:hypothetical protein